MPTGDGLLARLIVHEPISVSKVSTLCSAAEEHGNGVIEVTQRGNLQIRGLGAGSASKFARVIDSLRIGQDAGPPLHTSSLLGLDPGEPFRAEPLVHSLLASFRRLRPALPTVSPKVTVLVDGGGRLHLDAVTADIRLVAVKHSLLQLSVAGNAANAMQLGHVTMDHAVQTVEVLLRALACMGPEARARDLVRESVTQEMRELLHVGELECRDPPPPAEPVGTHLLNEGTVALGFGLPFGHTTATLLKYIVAAAEEHGATSMRPAPGRAVLAIGLAPSAVDKLSQVIAKMDLIVHPADPRRHVVACAGAPACGAAKLATRQLAADVARATEALGKSGKIVHLAGCSKGCAHAGIAALTIVGPDRIVLNGRADDPPHASVSSAGLIADLTRLCG